MSSSSAGMLRSAPEREPVEQRQDHEIEEARKDEHLSQVDGLRKEEDREEQALHEEDPERRPEEHEVPVAGPAKGDHRDEGQSKSENRNSCQQDVLDRHQGNRREP